MSRVMGLVSPLVASLIGRIGLRRTMTIGTLLSAAGYALLAVAPSITVILLLYALPIGIGLAMFGPFPAVNWRGASWVDWTARSPSGAEIAVDGGMLTGQYYEGFPGAPGVS